MNRVVPLIGISIAFLFAFLAALLVSQLWLRQQSEAVRAEALKQKRAQFEHVVELARLPPPPWDEATTAALSQAIDASVTARAIGEPSRDGGGANANASTEWAVTVPLTNADGVAHHEIEVRFPAPPAARLARTYQSLASVLFVLTSGFVFLVAVASLWLARGARELPPIAETTDGANARNEISSLAQLARTSVQQSAQLERERTERLRLAEDFTIQQMLLNRTLEEKIHLGQDLHDGIIQSLYATGLTLEAAKNALAKKPREAAILIETSQQSLNVTIREVRSFIRGLAPECAKDGTFSESARSLITMLGRGQSLATNVTADDDAVASMSESARSDLLQIVREAVSNSLRHGRATAIDVRLMRRDGVLRLEVIDNGCGFEPAETASRGLGLNNIQARSRRMGAEWSVASTPGRGTTVAITFDSPPIVASA